MTLSGITLVNKECRGAKHALRSSPELSHRRLKHQANGSAPPRLDSAPLLMSGVTALMSLLFMNVLPAAAQNPTVEFWYGSPQYFGQNGEPQRWINVLGNASDAEHIEALTFSLNDQYTDTLTIGGDLHRLARPGDFNVELAWDDLKSGKNELSVTAWYDEGRTVTARTLLIVERGNTWPLPYRVDFTAVDSLQRVVQVVDGNWTLTDEGVRTVTPYYDRVLALGDTTWADYDARIRFTVHDFTPSEKGPPTYDVTHFGMAMRWRGHHADEHQPNRKWYPMGSQGELLLHSLPDSSRYRILFGSEYKTVVAERRFPVALGVERWVRTQVQTLTDGSTLYRYKTWQADEAEPKDWNVDGAEPGTLDYRSGSLCIVPHNSDVTVHEVSVVPL